MMPPPLPLPPSLLSRSLAANAYALATTGVPLPSNANLFFFDKMGDHGHLIFGKLVAFLLVFPLRLLIAAATISCCEGWACVCPLQLH